MTVDDSTTIRVKGWDRFQHYRHRRPPWIKLHREILEDYTWWSLSLASRALAPCLWLIASESDDGSIAPDLKMLSFRLRTKPDEILRVVKELTDNGFLECSQDASAMLADRSRAASKVLYQSTEDRDREETEERQSPEAESAKALARRGDGATTSGKRLNGTATERAAIDHARQLLGRPMGGSYTLADCKAMARARAHYQPADIDAVLSSVRSGTTPSGVWCRDRLASLELAYMLRPGEKGAADKIMSQLANAPPGGYDTATLSGTANGNGYGTQSAKAKQHRIDTENAIRAGMKGDGTAGPAWGVKR